MRPQTPGAAEATENGALPTSATSTAGAAGSEPLPPPVPDSDSSLISCNATFTSPMCWNRRSGSLRRQRKIDLLQIAGHVGNDFDWRLRLRPHDGGQRVRRRRARKGTHASHHLVQHRAEAEDVAARIHLPAGGLLRRHVRRRCPAIVPGTLSAHIRCVRQLRFLRRRRVQSVWPGRSRAPSPRRPRRP